MGVESQDYREIIEELEGRISQFTEACQAVHETANGNTHGLTETEQLTALRLACELCGEALHGR